MLMSDVVAPAAAPRPAIVAALPVLDDVVIDFEELPRRGFSFGGIFESMHRHSLAVFAILLLLVGGSAVEVGQAYWSAHISLAAASRNVVLRIPAQPARGPNIVVGSAQLSETLQRITNQPLNLLIGDKTVPVGADNIRDWLQVVTDQRTNVSYIHVKQSAINKSLSETAAPFIKAPVDQVTIAYPDGGSKVIAAGRNGAQLGDTSGLAKQIGQTVLGAKGMQLNMPVETLAFAAVTPAAFDKLIEVNVVTKQMYLYDKGQLTHSYPISAGAPVTPTPIGQYKIYSKFAVQDMKGFNANGSKYFQPHVHWINYFLPGGYAVHGNYWRPVSAFGATNTSHGCVSLPDDQAKQVYDWAPLGTTVITHN